MKWEKVPFLDVVDDITSGNRKFQSSEYMEEGLYPIIDQGASFISGYTNEENLVKRTKPIIVFGDHTKKLQYVDYDFCLGADGVKVLSTASKLLPKYLYFYLQTVKLPDVGYSRHYKFLKECFIPLPPLHIQEQIADTLDKADALRKKDQELLTKYDELAQAIFYDMFGDPDRNDKNWSSKQLNEAVSFIDYRGKTPERSNKEDVTLITAKNVKFGYYDFSEKDYVTESTYQKIMTRGFPRFNDVLFTTEGATLGNVCRIPNILKFAVGQRLISMRGKQVTQEYLSFIMCSSFFQEQVKKKATGSAVKGIRSAELKKLIIPIPDFSIQEIFSSKVKNIENQKMKIIITLSSGLFNGLMNKYFS